MSEFTKDIMVLENQRNQALKLQAKIDELKGKLNDMNNQYVVMLEAQQLLTTVSDNNTTLVLDYITGIINKTLGELFPHDNRRIYLENTMFHGQHAHINIKLTGTNGVVRDLQLQSGTGLRQVISFLFILTLIEVRKGRRFMMADELLSGLHPEAKRIITDIIEIFASEGFQFSLVEYGFDNIGKLYIVEKPDKEAFVTPLEKDHYDNEVFVFNRPPEEVDMTIHVNEWMPDEVEA